MRRSLLLLFVFGLDYPTKVDFNGKKGRVSSFFWEEVEEGLAEFGFEDGIIWTLGVGNEGGGGIEFDEFWFISDKGEVDGKIIGTKFGGVLGDFGDEVVDRLGELGEFEFDDFGSQCDIGEEGIWKGEAGVGENNFVFEDAEADVVDAGENGGEAGGGVEKFLEDEGEVVFGF